MSCLFAWLTQSPVTLLIIGIVILLLFGDRLPRVMRSLGQGVVEFKKGVAGIEDDVDEAGKKKEKDKEKEPEKVQDAQAAKP